METVANYNGFTTKKPDIDFGVDLEIKEINKVDNRKRIIETGRRLDIQLKATTENKIKYDNGYLKYELEAKTYNDLIDRKNRFHNPLILVLFIIPDNKEDWIELTDEELKLRKCAFWYFPKEQDINTSNTSTITIKIKKDNIIIDTNFKQLFDKFN